MHLFRFIDAVSKILLASLNDDERETIALPLLQFLADLAFEPAVKHFLGEQLLSPLFDNLLSRSKAGKNDIGIQKSALVLFKNCCAQTEKIQIQLASLILHALEQCTDLTPFLSRVCSFIFTLSDSISVCLGDRILLESVSLSNASSDKSLYCVIYFQDGRGS